MIRNQNACPRNIPFVKLSNTMENQEQSQEVRSLLSAFTLRRFGFKIWLILVSIIWLSMVAITWSEARASDSEEYNFSWLDPDKKIYVLQNRRYTKANRPLISVMGGIGLSNPYKTTVNLDGRLGFYFSEKFGVEGLYTASFHSPNSNLKALEQASPNALPKMRQIDALAGGMIHFVPWYAKMNMFNQILYFDWYFGAGLGVISTRINTRDRVSQPDNLQKQTFTAYILSTGHQYYMSEHFIARIDFTGSFYRAPIHGLTGESTWYSNYNFALGFGWRM